MTTEHMIESLRKELPNVIYDTWAGDSKHFDSYAMEQSVKVADAVVIAVLRMLDKTDSSVQRPKSNAHHPDVIVWRESDGPLLGLPSGIRSWGGGSDG